MRISDWSSDVCSSDLLAVAQEVVPVSLAPIWRIEGQNNANIAVFRGFDLGAKGQVIGRLPHRLVGLGAFAPVTPAIRVRGPVRPRQADAITHPALRPISRTTGSAAYRKRCESDTRVSVLVDPGGRRLNKKTKK